jgi:cytochrome c oxidase subunit 2
LPTTHQEIPVTIPKHPTTRRSFIAAAGFGGVSLYALWAIYGAAPSPLAILKQPDDVAAGGHDAHGTSGDGMTVEDFRRLTADFVDRFSIPGGSVHPRAMLGESNGQHNSETGHATEHVGHGDTAAASPGAAPVDVYLLAERWYYEPANLHLDRSVPYRFRMMAADLSHGASIQFGTGGRIIRLRPGRVTEMQAEFSEPGRFLIYCTVYCGEGHDVMQGRIDVV